jgi:tRNA-modifying protein YgfZ
MRDNPQPADPLFFGLPGHRILAIDGRDATSFAHAQFMNDVAALPDGQWQWNGWLTPKGRVIALFAVLKFDPQALWLVLPDAAPAELAEALRRFVFRSKVTLAARKDLHVMGNFAPALAATGARFARDHDDVVLDFGAPDTPRTLRISTTPGTTNESDIARWDAIDLVHGLPRLDELQAGQWTPQQLSLDRLRAYSIKKGCYPGQEIVARTHFLGQAKRGLVLLEAGDVLLASGADVTDGERAIGTVVSASSGGAEHLALAVLPLDRPATPLHVEGISVRERALLGGLER